jgi:signal peptidase I
VDSDDLTSGESPPPGEGDGDGESSAQPTRRRRRRSWVTETIVLIVVALAVALTIKTYLVQPFRIPSASMEDTLLIGDKVLVNKLVGHLSQIHRGDVIVFNGAGSWDPPVHTSSNPLDRFYRDVLSLFGDDSGEIDYIKRVIGLPGDHVRCCNAAGLVTVNGVPLHEKAYLFPGSAPSSIPFSIVVPPGRLWVMGDNRGDSEDSRLHHCGTPGAECEPYDRSGTIPESKVIGRAFLIVWPLSQFKMLWVPKTFSTPGLSSAAAAVARVLPAGPALPLSAGVAVAAPLTLLERRIRLRRRSPGRPPRP